MELTSMLPTDYGEAIRPTGNKKGKTEFSLIPLSCIEGAARVLMQSRDDGTYDEHDWAKGKYSWRTMQDALMRHLMAWEGGQDIDPKSGLPHIDHVITNAIMLKHYTMHHPAQDNRFKG